MSGTDRTTRPTPEQRQAIGRKAAESLMLTVADFGDIREVTDEASMYDLITHQAGNRTWDEIIRATYEQVASNGMPSCVLEAGTRKGFDRITVGRLVQEAAESVFHGETPDAEPQPERIPDGTLVEWTGVDAYGTSLIAGDLIRVTGSGDNGDPVDSISYEVTGNGDSNGPDGHGIFSVRSRHIKRPTITAGPEQRAFTIAPALYSSAVEVGTLVEVRSGPDGDGDFYCRTVDSQTTCYLKADGLEPWTPARQKAEDDKAAVGALAAQAIEEQPEVIALRAQVEQQRTQLAEQYRWRSRAESDMTAASERLIEEATRRNWCSEYDQIIDDINGRMSVLSFDQREQEVDMEAEIEAEVTVELNGYTLNGTITVSIGYTGLPDEDPCDADYISDETVEEYCASALGIAYRAVSVDSWNVESYDRA